VGKIEKFLDACRGIYGFFISPPKNIINQNLSLEEGVFFYLNTNKEI